MDELRAALRDRWLWAIQLLSLILRVTPAALWPSEDCIRDECIYRSIANKIVDGHGLTTSNKGWLPAPGYPYLLAWSREITGSMQAVKVLQVGLSAASLLLVYLLARRVAGDRTARIAALLFAIHPTLAFFATTMWIETIYIFFMLAAIWAVLWARDPSRWWRGIVPGVLLAIAILFRGIATYLPPMYAIALLWPEGGLSAGVAGFRETVRGRWKHVLAMFVATTLTVAPWSMYASPRQGGFLVSDATVGHVLWLGNNDYPPLTFDYGIGMLTEDLFMKYLHTGRPPCDRTAPPVVSSKCEVKAAVGWIEEHPGEFVSRVPMRLAQLFNPNTFLTRHILWGYWPGLPWWLKELLVVYIILSSVMTQIVGTIGVWARARGPYAVMAILTVCYTVFASAVMYGMTRFRLPLEPLWIVYLAWLLADWRGAIAALRASPGRMAGAVVSTLLLTWLVAWYLPTGFPMFW